MAYNVFGGELLQLWMVSDVHLPRVAAQFYNANHDVAGVSADEGLSSVTSYAWSQLHDELQSMYAQLGDTVMTAAEGVRKATRAYIDADMASQAELDACKDNGIDHSLSDRESNPPVQGDDDYPSKPILPGQQ